jgi:hypothetical protein
MSLARSMSPAQLQAFTAAGLVRAAELGRHLDDMQDALDETRHPSVPYDHPSWSDPSTWEISPAIPPGTSVVPPEVTDAELDADWPEPDDSWKPWYERRQNAAETAANEAERKRSRYLST